MKWAVKLLLLVFVAFLATPTIVSLIKENSDNSAFYNFAEEEQPHKDLQDIKAEIRTVDYQLYPPLARVVEPIHFENRSRHDVISPAIFAPPPNA